MVEEQKLLAFLDAPERDAAGIGIRLIGNDPPRPDGPEFVCVHGEQVCKGARFEPANLE
ncbi:hypothetical protein ACFQY9_19525 [Microvirga aerilata]|uniref:hypothetical protein n=1 Tax=Microvirga aerilata TaxID=670292 RepID=UPI003634817A